MNICEYGCGQEAFYQMKNGKWCCSKSQNSCPTSREKNKMSKKLIPIETTELCNYGCGNIAKYKFNNGILCCSDHINKCSKIYEKISKNGKGSHKAISIETTELCGFGCGQVAKYKFKNGNICCSDHINKCLKSRKKRSKNQKGIILSKAIQIETTELCDYGCGLIAKYKFKNGKICCENHRSKCLKNREKNSKNGKGRFIPKAITIETIDLCSYGCGQEAKFKLKNKKICCSQNPHSCPINRKKLSKSGKGKNKLTISKIKEKKPTFAKVEPMRYNPDKPNEKEIQVRCKNHKCPNSEEQGGWFTPTSSQFHERIRCIEKPWGNDGAFFYCSEDCKDECPAYNMREDPNREIKKLPYTSGQYIEYRQKMFREQKEEFGYNFCEKCYSTENLHLHHYKPVKLYPLLALDPDNGHILCSKCHYEAHKKGTKCSTGYLANANPCE